MIKICDICGAKLDTTNPEVDEGLEYKNYSIIRVRTENRNPSKQAAYYSEGALMACARCMKKHVYDMPFGEVMDRMVERVNKEG